MAHLEAAAIGNTSSPGTSSPNTNRALASIAAAYALSVGATLTDTSADKITGTGPRTAMRERCLGYLEAAAAREGALARPAVVVATADAVTHLIGLSAEVSTTALTHAATIIDKALADSLAFSAWSGAALSDEAVESLMRAIGAALEVTAASVHALEMRPNITAEQKERVRSEMGSGVVVGSEVQGAGSEAGSGDEGSGDESSGDEGSGGMESAPSLHGEEGGSGSGDEGSGSGEGGSGEGEGSGGEGGSGIVELSSRPAAPITSFYLNADSTAVQSEYSRLATRLLSSSRALALVVMRAGLDEPHPSYAPLRRAAAAEGMGVAAVWQTSCDPSFRPDESLLLTVDEYGRGGSLGLQLADVSK